ncbi:unnamed protein product [Candidula unifasciata]|uniref:Tetratricopeptide repeat protein 28 n=1 Tax=Candidula unifasciata TaxID=100452 RepID=A0A8S3Z4X4_9EUPU|nr:unnamed protein product [Candidula unifasciata]
MKAERVTELAKEVEHLSRLGASRLQHGNTEKALEAYRQAYLRSQLLGHNGYMQRACAFNLGSMLISTGNFTEGLNYLKLAKPPEGYRDGKSNGDLYFNSGLAYEGLQNVEETKHCYSKALEEYRWEHNINMEADVLGRLGKAYLMCDQFTEAASCLKQLIHVQEKLGDYTKQLQSQAEQASLLLRMDQVAEAEKIADDCFLRCQGDELSNSIANVLTELSLTYTQMRSYDKALRCCQIALPLVAAKDADAKQIAILYQNLGVINSYLGQYQNAIEYHQKAASKYAELSIRKCQGHCFINMGYAYSQLGDIHRAGEYFLHSLQAAKDCGEH